MTIINSLEILFLTMIDMRATLEKLSRLTDADWESVKNSFTFQSVKKGQFLVRPGDFVDRAYFVGSGFFRIFGIFDGKETIRNFFGPGSFFSETLAYFTESASIFFLEALEDSTVYHISRTKSDRLFDQNISLMRLKLRIYESNLIGLASRSLQMLEGNGQDRYMNLRRRWPELFNKVPQYMIASYLGVTPEALSRIIKKADQDL